MKLVSSREAVQFLSQVGPPPWVKRLLRWMAFDEDLPAYSACGKVQAVCSVLDLVSGRIKHYNQLSASELDRLIRQEFDNDMANRLIKSKPYELVKDEMVEWKRESDPVRLDPGFFLYAKRIDWEVGIMKSSFHIYSSADREFYFPNHEYFLASQFEMPRFDLFAEGLSFDFESIEMLLPSMRFVDNPSIAAQSPMPSARTGRPRKWDWEGAMAFLISQAQLPDGLPTGPGAQARIEEMIRDWFLMESDKTPATSQIRDRAAMIMRELERPKKP